MTRSAWSLTQFTTTPPTATGRRSWRGCGSWASRHLRDGVYANPSPEWRDWNERYYRAVELAAAHGMRFTFGMGQPGQRDRHDRPARGRRRGPAAPRRRGARGSERVRQVRRRPALAVAARRPTAATLYRKVKAHAVACARCRSSGRSFSTAGPPKLFGDQRSWMDRGQRPSLHGRALAGPRPPAHRARARASRLGRQAGLGDRGGLPQRHARDAPGSRPSRSAVAAIYLLRTFLEHFRSGIPRTYAYELVDEKPERAGRDPEQHFGLLRSDFTPQAGLQRAEEPPDARRAGTTGGRACGRSGWTSPARAPTCADSCCRRPTAPTSWRSGALRSAWDRDRRRPLRVPPTPRDRDRPGCGSRRGRGPGRLARQPPAPPPRRPCAPAGSRPGRWF